MKPRATISHPEHDLPKDLLTPKQVATLLRCSPDTVIRKVRAKDIPGYDLPIGVRVSESQLAAHIYAHHNSQIIKSGRPQQGLRCLGERP